MQEYYYIRKLEAGEKGKAEVWFDNGMICQLYRGEIRQFHLEAGSSLTEAQYRVLIHDVVGKRAKKRAMYLLEAQDQSEQRLREKLRKNGYPQICIDEAIAYVKKFHYLDDQRYACTFIRFSKEKLSRKQMEIKLLQKGISKGDIEAALEEEYPRDEADDIELEQIRKLLQKRHFDPETADEKEFQRTYAYLARRGFSGGKILSEMKHP